AGAQTGFVEGSAEAGGSVGLVRAPLEESELSLALTAVAHELLHCVGAIDKYGGDGHPINEASLAEPELVPLYPQRMAEIMIGEVSLGPKQGRSPQSLQEIAVGPVTAREIRWVRP